MLKKSITYEDFFGNTHTDDFYFNISRAEFSEMILLEMEVIKDENGNKTEKAKDGFMERLEAIGESAKGAEIIPFFKDLVLRSYGIRSSDGRYFDKKAEDATKFEMSGAYDTLWMELVTDAGAASEFVNEVMPKNFKEQAKVIKSEQPMTTAERAAALGARQPTDRQEVRPAEPETRIDAPITRADDSPLNDPDYLAYLAAKKNVPR